MKQMTRPAPALTAERDAYDPSVETVWCVLSYEGEGEPLEYGASYWLDVREEDGSLDPGAAGGEHRSGMPCCTPCHPVKNRRFPASLSMFDYDFSDGGRFRVVKDRSGTRP